MPQACRITDKMSGGVSHHNAHIIGYTADGSPIYCSGHSVTGSQVTGQNKVLIGSLQAVTIGNTGSTTCPCCGSDYTNVAGSKKVFINGKPAVRIGDGVNIHGVGSGNMTTGSSKVIMA